MMPVAQVGSEVSRVGIEITYGWAGWLQTSGGAILNTGGTLTVANDILSYNEAVNADSATGGGAIHNRNGATLTVTGSTFIGNQAIGRDRGGVAGGGGIY